MDNKIDINNFTYDKYLDGECGILDAHCHIGLTPHPKLYAEAIKDFCAISYGTKPEQYSLDIKFAKPEISVGLGLHPWEIEHDPDNAKAQLELFEKCFDQAQHIGEIGLDFARKNIACKDTQIKTFTDICRMLAKTKGKVVSIHSVKAADDVLKILHETEADINNTIVFHWFVGSIQQLNTAIVRGYYFSCGPRMATNDKGMNTIQSIPARQLLIETDMPWDNEPITPIEHFNLINDFLMELRDIKREESML